VSHEVAMIGISDITLGILAGGRATRLGGCDKAWLECGGVPQVLRMARRFAGEVSCTLVSANRQDSRYASHGLTVIADRKVDVGPLGGLDALAAVCATPWLLTVPVDLVGVNECLVPTLIASAGESGAFARDDDGLQPLVALWRIERLRGAAPGAMQAGELSMQALQARMGMTCVRFTGVRFGNLNTPADLAAAGIATP
jgi:molybdopterin-guanine dinucleotide biosynthesis protein A